jgi:hypothetical protein
MSAAAMANWAAGSSGVGPGVNKRVLRIMVFSSVSGTGLGIGCGTLLGNQQSQNTHFCGICGIKPEDF